MATNNTTTSKYDVLKHKYSKARKEQSRLEQTKADLVVALQTGRTINNFDAKLRIIDIAIEKVNLEADLIREELTELGAAEWRAGEADRRAEAMLRKAEAQAKREAIAKKMSVDTPFAKALAQK